MATDIKYLSELFRIVSGAIRLDTPKVRNYTSFLADKLEADGETSSANRLRQLLAETDHQIHPARVAMRSVPVDGETRFPLLEKVSTGEAARHPVVLTAEQKDLVSEFISVARAQAQFESLSLKTALTLLLYGPPGCGKTHLALHIGHELGLPVYVARLDGLISSFLGSTAKNIRAIFEFAASTPAVLLLDEFDAIAKLRDDAQEVGELKRVVNSFLQNLDALGSQTILIAATNHHTLLDSAVWRRFTYRLELQYPSAETRAAVWRTYLEEVHFTGRQFQMLVDLSDGFSGADIREASLRVRRKAIAASQEPTLHDAFLGLVQLSSGEGEGSRFLAALRGLDPQVAARKLHARNPDLYSSAGIGAVLGVSKPTAHRWTREGESPDGHHRTQKQGTPRRRSA